MPTNRLVTLATQQRAQIQAEDARNLDAITRAYLAMYDRLQGDVSALQSEIEQMDAPTAAKIKALPQYKRLIRRSTDELDRYFAYLETTAMTAAGVAVALGLSHSRQLVNVAARGKFVGLDQNSMTRLLNYLRTEGPLYARLKILTGETVDKVVQAILQGVGAGKNPREIARNIQEAFGGGLTDALRNVRTVQIKSYQDAARANYMASNGIVTGWVWMANLEGNPCASCIAMHGTIHGLDETLDDHYNGECTPLPYIPEFGNPIDQTGKDWFDSLSPEAQSAILGKDKHAAYAAGKFEFSALSRQVPNDIYGTMRQVTPLKDLVSP